MHAIFISDLHLEDDRPELTDFFYRFLDKRTLGADKLFILGDFFEYWVGDDEQTVLQCEVASRLQRVAERGTDIFLMHGNRDFLIGETFATQCGAKLIQEPYELELGELRAMLLHGDSFCTEDTEYMKFRSFARNPQWQAQVLNRPLHERVKMAEQMRQLSMAKNKGKAMEIMDVTQQAVEAVAQQYDADLIIHGHTHRPAVHRFNHSGKEAKRIVLGDWHESCYYLEAFNSNLELIKVSRDELG